MAKSKKDQLKVTEQAAIKESEPQLEVDITEQNVDEAVVDAGMAEAGADADPVMPAEASAVNTDTDIAVEASVQTAAKTTKSAKKETAVVKPKQRSTKYQAASGKLADRDTVSLTEAVERVKQTSYSAFDGTVELHAQMVVKKGNATESVRAVIQLPNGAPRQVNAVVLTEQMIDEIASSKRANADMYLATPALMPKVAKIAKILGPQGKMPNPKTGTVTDNPDAALKEIQSGRVEYRADAQGIVHMGVGKVSWKTEDLVGNTLAVLQSIGVNRLRGVTLTSTMGPGIAVDVTRLS